MLCKHPVRPLFGLPSCLLNKSIFFRPCRDWFGLFVALTSPEGLGYFQGIFYISPNVSHEFSPFGGGVAETEQTRDAALLTSWDCWWLDGFLPMDFRASRELRPPEDIIVDAAWAVLPCPFKKWSTAQLKWDSRSSSLPKKIQWRRGNDGLPRCAFWLGGFVTGRG